MRADSKSGEYWLKSRASAPILAVLAILAISSGPLLLTGTCAHSKFKRMLAHGRVSLRFNPGNFGSFGTPGNLFRPSAVAGTCARIANAGEYGLIVACFCTSILAILAVLAILAISSGPLLLTGTCFWHKGVLGGDAEENKFCHRFTQIDADAALSPRDNGRSGMRASDTHSAGGASRS